MTFKNFVEQLLNLTGRAKLFVLAFATTLLFLLDVYWFPGAGKSAENRSGAYSFQNNVWTGEIVKEYQRMHEEGLFRRVSTATSRNVTDEFVRDISLYNARMHQIMLMMRFQEQSTRHLIREMGPMYRAQESAMPKPKLAAMDKHMAALVAVSEDLNKRVAKLEKLLPRLVAAYDVPPDPNRSEAAKVKIAVEQISTLLILLSDRQLTPGPGDDPLKFVRTAGLAQSGVFDDYSYLVERHNETATKDEAWKNLWTLLILVSAAYLAYAGELKKLRSSSVAA